MKTENKTHLKIIHIQLLMMWGYIISKISKVPNFVYFLLNTFTVC